MPTEAMPKSLLGIEQLSAAQIQAILERARIFKPVQTQGRKMDRLKGKTVIHLFFENSTRTRLSFEALDRDRVPRQI